jgi:hypothetical protein
MKMGKYYIDTQGNDDQAYAEAMRYACGLAREDPGVARIVLLIPSKANTGWFERLWGARTVKELFKGTKLKGCEAVFKLETKKTIKDHSETSIVIGCALDSDDLFKIDDFYSVSSTIAIPWQKGGVANWVGTWGPVDIRSGTSAQTFALPSCEVQRAMRSLTGNINMSTGITNSSDNELAKTYILALQKYDQRMDSNVVAGFLIRDLGWRTEAAAEVAQLIITLNKGGTFQGGDRTGLQKHYTRWQSECSERAIE